MELLSASVTALASTENFVGDVYVDTVVTGAATSHLTTALVRFTPSARTNWHSHADGQLLICTDGAGVVGTRDGSVVRLRAGDAVWTPAGQEHWHGGTATTMMCHYAIFVDDESGTATTWLEPVTDEQFDDAGATR